MVKYKNVNAVMETMYGLGKEYGVTVSEPAPGHFQLRGGLLVNYYPMSKKQTAYVAGTRTGKHHVSPMEAILMASTPPPIVPAQARDARKGRASRQRRQWLIEKKGVKTCHWCPTTLTIDTSTLEHIIPLTRGGLDQANNWTLACYPCNQDRGQNMPELEGNSDWVNMPVLEVPKAKNVQSAPEEVKPEPPATPSEKALAKKLESNESRAKFLTDLLYARSQGKELPANWPVLKIERELRKLKRARKLVNKEISTLEAKRYHAAFRSVAKDFLTEEMFRQIELEVERRHASLLGEESNGL